IDGDADYFAHHVGGWIMEKVLDEAQRQLRRHGAISLHAFTALGGGGCVAHERKSCGENKRQNEVSLRHLCLQAERCAEYMPVFMAQQTSCSRPYQDAARQWHR